MFSQPILWFDFKLPLRYYNLIQRLFKTYLNRNYCTNDFLKVSARNVTQWETYLTLHITRKINVLNICACMHKSLYFS